MISAITPPPMYICNLLWVLRGLPAADYPLNRKRNLSSAFVPPIITVRLNPGQPDRQAKPRIGCSSIAFGSTPVCPWLARFSRVSLA
jgi:hypothetical protein